jgi:hypothetical protein
MGLYTTEENGEIFSEMIVMCVDKFSNVGINLLTCSCDTVNGLSLNITSSRKVNVKYQSYVLNPVNTCQ